MDVVAKEQSMKEKVAMSKEGVNANQDMLETSVLNAMLDSILKEKGYLKNAKVCIFHSLSLKLWFYLLIECGCNPDGSDGDQTCDASGQCKCSGVVIGKKCDLCKPGFYDFPECKGTYFQISNSQI